MITSANSTHNAMERRSTMAGGRARSTSRTQATQHKQTLICDHFSADKSPSGQLVHTTKGHETRDVESLLRLSQYLSCCGLLEGSVDFVLNNVTHHFTSIELVTGAFAMSLMASSDWTRVLKKKGRYVSKVVVSLLYRWINSRVQLGSMFTTQFNGSQKNIIRDLIGKPLRN